MSNESHIVLISSRLDLPGGTEKALVSLAGLFAKQGHQVTILVLDNKKGSFFPIHDEVSVQYVNLMFGLRPEINWFKRKLDFLKSIWGLHKLWQSLKPNVIISTDYTHVVGTIFSGGKRYAKCWSWEHHAFGWLSKSALWESLLRYSYSRLHGVIVVNNSEAKNFEKYCSNTRVIPNFISKTSDAASSLEKKMILSVGWLIHRKGIDLLLLAAKTVLKKYPDWTWKIIGTGEKELEVRKFITENGLEQTLVLQPPTSSDLSSEYSNCSIFVLASRIEVFGLVLVEAMGYGVPSIALLRADGPASIIQHEKNGLLVSENAHEIANAVSRLIEDVGLRKCLGMNATQNADRFAPAVIYEKWEKLIS